MKTKTYNEYETEVLFEGKWEGIAISPNIELALESKAFYENEDPDVEAARIAIYEVVEKDELKFSMFRGSREILNRKLINRIG